MPALRSFKLTAPQMRCDIKRVSRRLTCSLRPGQLICATDRSQRVGPLYEELGIWRVLKVEGPAPLCDDLDAREVTAEGFTGWSPSEFMAMFCAANRQPDTVPVYRFEFEPTPETAKAITARIFDARLAATFPGRPLLIGHAPGRGTHDNADGWPAFCGGPGGRRIGRLLGGDWRTTVRTFERTNLLGRWPGRAGRGHRPAALARQAAAELAPTLDGRTVLCAGRGVWDAVCRAVAPGHEGDDPLTVVEPDDGPRLVAHLPHPSGTSAWWNDDDRRRRTAEWLRDLVTSETPSRIQSRICLPQSMNVRRMGDVHPFALEISGRTYCPVCGRWTSP